MMNYLISRPAAIEKLNERAREKFSIHPGFEYYIGALHDVADDLRNMQTIDAVPVVRCKDCETLITRTQGGKSVYYCPFIGHYTCETFFCAKGRSLKDNV